MAENPFTKAMRGKKSPGFIERSKKASKAFIKKLTPAERKELGLAQGEYGVAVADSVRGSHRIWRKGRSGDKSRGTEKRYI